MATNTLKTRVKLLYKTYSEWDAIKATFVPLQGEVCFVEVPASTGSVVQEPALLWKVGDGVKTFAQLPYGSAIAADVYNWAKKSTLDWNDLDATFLEKLDEFIEAESDTDTQYKIVKDTADTYHVETRHLKDGLWSEWTTDTQSASISLAHKVDKQITGTNGKALIFNESDGGGAKFENNDGTNSFVGVNDGGKDGLTAQIYSIDKTTNKGTRINVTSNGIFYTNGRTSYSQTTAEDEIATKGNLLDAVNALDFAELAVANSETIKAISQTDGQISVEKQAIQIAESQVTGLIADLASKTPHTINGTNGKAQIFNESDGGGAMFTHNDGTKSFIGVNDGGNGGLAAQIYAKDSTTNIGARLNISNTGIYYTNGLTNGSYTDDDELVTVGTLKSLGDALHYIGMTTLQDGETEEQALNRIVAAYQVAHPTYVLTAGAVAIVNETTEAGTFAKEFIRSDADGGRWDEFGNEGIYETKVEANAAHQSIMEALGAEEAARIANDALKVNITENGTNGKALIFNEVDGGGAKFEHNDGTYSFMGVNDGGANGLSGQIYSVNKDTKVGTRINVTSNGIYYTNGKSSMAYDAGDEIATMKDVTGLAQTIASEGHLGLVSASNGATIDGISVDQTDGEMSVNDINIMKLTNDNNDGTQDLLILDCNNDLV